MGEADALRRLVDDEWARAAAEERGRTRRLREQAAEESTLAGALLDAAEAGVAVRLRTSGGRDHQGMVLGVGSDFCALRLRGGRWLYAAIGAVSSLRVEPGVRAGDPSRRAEPADQSLAEVLAHLAPERPRVMLWAGADPEPVVGELRAVGEDVATVAAEGAGRPLVYVRLGAITEAAVEVG